MDRVRRIADAVLYEGYVLWPYRRSALKNQRRWTFGGVYPQGHTRGASRRPLRDADAVPRAGTAAGARLEVRVRFLHVVERSVARLTASGREPVEELVVGGERYVPWEEATEREVVTELRPGARERVEIGVPAGEEHEVLHDTAGEPVGIVTRSWRALAGGVEVGVASRWSADLSRITVRISNTSAVRRRRPRGGAASDVLLDPHDPADRGRRAGLADRPSGNSPRGGRGCENIGTWPVLAGEPGERHTVLSSPIILPDHPEIAPESPGDLFDAGEIDQLLTLSILTLTDEEKQQMREADPRTREILERTESLSREELMRLHGTIREFGMAR